MQYLLLGILNFLFEVKKNAFIMLKDIVGAKEIKLKASFI